jgi:uncharacterized membrane protein YqhA
VRGLDRALGSTSSTASLNNNAVLWQVVIRVTFVASAIFLAWIERLLLVKGAKH